MIPDITVRSRIGAHEDLDRFFGIIAESFEFLFCGRFARGWNSDIFNTLNCFGLLRGSAFLNAKENLELEMRFVVSATKEKINYFSPFPI
jgi:hypothetical protein